MEMGLGLKAIGDARSDATRWGVVCELHRCGRRGCGLDKKKVTRAGSGE